jgi:hypothetical protein
MIPILILLGLFFLFSSNLKALAEKIIGGPIPNSVTVIAVIFAIFLSLLLIQTCK